ncbi:hypothetical protein [Pseudofrankia asymbiotica]|uniref:hypothetical protein n=1 Tax=Pseudofrankia asymbiotica TaxID=1834516 RepID=UPI001F522B1D|nr:hypothetical protein [Pseudofrankia asymbiotica]
MRLAGNLALGDEATVDVDGAPVGPREVVLCRVPGSRGETGQGDPEAEQGFPAGRCARGLGEGIDVEAGQAVRRVHTILLGVEHGQLLISFQGGEEELVLAR